ncbi:MAG: MarR family winged helix-turn-helix transcriptional regulator [Flavobacteriales bacterium]
MANIDEEIKTKFENNKHRFIANLMFTTNWFRNMNSEFLKPYKISMPQFNILRILRGAKDWVSMNDIKSLMVDKSPNATRLADKLVLANLVERQRSESDRRVVYLKITPKGLELLSNIDESDTPHLNFLENITEEEARMVSDIFDRLRS